MTRQNEPLPGEMARRVLERTCSAHTMERVFDPFLADLQAEWLAIRSREKTAFAHWRLWNAYGSLAIQITVCALGSLRRPALAAVPAAGAAVPLATTGSPNDNPEIPMPLCNWA